MNNLKLDVAYIKYIIIIINLQKRVPCMTGEPLDWERTAGRRMAGTLSFD